MAEVMQQQNPGQASAAGPSGGGDGNDPNRRNAEQPGRAHYSTDELVAQWRLIFNRKSGSAGMKGKHRRCVRCGSERHEHHRKHWQIQKCICVLCGNKRGDGHYGAPCPVMLENPEVFTKTWVKDALSGYAGVRKGELPAAISAADFRAQRNEQFRIQSREQARQQPAPAPAQPVAVAAPQQLLPPFNLQNMLLPMAMGMMMAAMGASSVMPSPMLFNQQAMAAAPFAAPVLPAALQQQQSSRSRGGGRGRGGIGGTRGRGGGTGVAPARVDAIADATRALAPAFGEGEDAEDEEMEEVGDGDGGENGAQDGA
jgi:hypothetical protein